MTIVRAVLLLLAIGGGGAWLMWRRFKKSDEPAQLVARWLLTAGVLVAAGFTIDFTTNDALEQIAGVFQAMAYGGVLAAIWTRSLVSIFANRIGGLYDGGSVPGEPMPLYSIAEARRKAGKYQEALYEVQGQLERFPTDAAGHLMMAEIQAANLKDFAGAERTIERFCHQPGHPPKVIAAALTLLADLHLQYARDPAAARRAFEALIAQLPDTPEAHQAQQRIAHLAGAERRIAPAVRVPLAVKPGRRDVGLQRASAGPAEPDQTPEQRAAEYVNHLEQYPQDDDAREQLAILYAEHYQRLDLATDQLEQLIQQPTIAPKQAAHWLNRLADLQVKLGAPLETVQATLQRMVDLNPKAAAADHARQRLAVLKLQCKRNAAGQSLKLGSYEKDLGLKKGWGGKAAPDPPSE